MYEDFNTPAGLQEKGNPIPAEETSAPRTEAPAKPKKFQKARELILAGTNRFLSEKQIEFGIAILDATHNGFAESFSGLKEGLKAIRGGIEKKVPQSEKVFHGLGTAARYAGKGAVIAGHATGRGLRATGRQISAAGNTARARLKDLKESGAVDEAKARLSSAASHAAQKMSEKAITVSERMSHAGQAAGMKMSQAGRNAGMRWSAMKNQALQKIEEHKAQRAAHAESEEENRLKALSDKARGGFHSLTEKTRHAADGAKERLTESLSDVRDRAHVSESLGRFSHNAADLAAKAKASLENFYNIEKKDQ